MAHGAGGKATQTLIEGLFVPAYGGATLATMADAGAAGDMVMTTDSLRRQAAALPGRLDRRARGQRHGQRPRRRGRAAARADDRDDPRGGPGLGRPARRGRGDRRAPPARRASRSSPATPRSSSAATPTRCTSRPPASGAPTRARGSARRALRPGDKVLLSGSIGEHGTAIMLARGEFELEAEVESDTRSLWPVADALLEAAGDGLRCMRDATRGGVASVLNELARASGVAMVVREAERARRPGRGRGGGDPRDRPHVRGQRGQARRLRRAGAGGRGPGRAARRARAASARPRSARCARSRRGWCWWRRASAAGGSWTSWWAIRCRGSVERSERCRSSSHRGSTRRRRSPPT